MISLSISFTSSTYNTRYRTSLVKMCRIIIYYFTCKHHVKLQKSRCGGTFHRITRSGTSVACKAGPYLELCLPFACDPCQQTQWDTAWKRKLERAETFFKKLGTFPGTLEIRKLISELQHEYDEASWNRSRSLQLHKQPINKAIMGRKQSYPSPLAQEIRSEDVVVNDQQNSEQEMAEEAAIFEVIDYTHPADLRDNSWADDYVPQSDYNPFEDVENPFENNETWHSDTSGQPPDQSENFMAWGPDADNPSATGVIRIDDANTVTAFTEEVIKLFWKFIGTDTEVKEQQSAHPAWTSTSTSTSPAPLSEELYARLGSLCISTSSSLPADLQTPPQTPPQKPTKNEHHWMDGTFDTPTTPIMSPSSTPTTPSSPQPLTPACRTLWDKKREAILKYKEKDAKKYYKEYLYICRCEARAQFQDRHI
jgi:hypothetical protein